MEPKQKDNIKLQFPPPLKQSSPNNKWKIGVKKNLNVNGVVQKKLEDHMAFLGDEKNACTSNKGPSNKSQSNDQTAKSPLKKIKHKIRP